MKRILLPALVALAALALARGAVADNSPFPATSSGDTFVIAQTVTTDGAMYDYFKPGDTVVFRAYAVDGKNHKILTEAKFFYATIPGQPNVKFKYDPKAKTALGQYAWIGTWTVPPIAAEAPKATCAVPRIFSSSRMLPVSVAASLVPIPSSATFVPGVPWAARSW